MVNLQLHQHDLDAFLQKFAHDLKKGDIILLNGPLGAGKTTLAKALIPLLTGIDDDIQSPTFPICLTYEGDPFDVVHYDLYRLSDNTNLEEFGWYDTRPHVITIAEWGERAAPEFLSAPGFSIDIAFTNEDNKRVITIEKLIS